jgi:hypothetical protein
MVQARTSLEAYRTLAEQAGRNLTIVHDRGALAPNEISLFARVRNERVLIGQFLDYYRRLGVGRFFIVDNGSSDGTFEFLSSAPDVNLWTTASSYAEANGGNLWIDSILYERARGRWVLHVDCDEFLVFKGVGKNALPRLIQTLERRNMNRLFAPMLDMYSRRPIVKTVIGPGDDPLEICSYFDGEPETVITWQDEKIYVGGARQRMFFADQHGKPNLNKFPLLRYDDDAAFVSIHCPVPFSKNPSIPFGRLLHVKLHSEFSDRAYRAVEEKQYWMGAMEYFRYREILSKKWRLKCYYKNSRQYRGPDSLIDAGFMADIEADDAIHVPELKQAG